MNRVYRLAPAKVVFVGARRLTLSVQEQIFVKETTVSLSIVRAVSGLLILTLLGAAAGCSDNKPFTINGSLSYKGEPVIAGIVKFYGPGDQSSMAYVRDGTFIITDLAPGEFKVSVESDDSSAKEAGAKSGKPVVLPRKYADAKTSGLVYTITARTRDLSINLD